MKKFVKVAVCLGMCLSFSGCFSTAYNREVKNEIETCKDCKSVTDIVSLVDNIEKTMYSVDAISGNYELVNTKQTFNISFDAITKDKRIDWDMVAKTTINNKNISIYFKDTKFYVVYPNNGANIIMKDKIVNLVKESEDTLDKLNATYKKQDLESMLTGDKLSGFNFDAIRENATYIVNSDNTYTITYLDNSLEWQVNVSSNYLINEIRCKAINFTSVLKFNYPSTLSINYPMGLDVLTLDIKEVKEVLKITSFAELIDEDLKQTSK